MKDMAEIPTSELEKDLQEIITDINVCETALMIRITKYGGGPVEERITENKHIVGVITDELNRRTK